MAVRWSKVLREHLIGLSPLLFDPPPFAPMAVPLALDVEGVHRAIVLMTHLPSPFAVPDTCRILGRISPWGWEKQ
jgi:hypothetical protein